MSPKLKYENQIFLLALGAALPSVILVLFLLGKSELPLPLRWFLGLLCGLTAMALAYLVRTRVIRPLQTASNLLSALREQDFSFRARNPLQDDALGELMVEINALSQTLHEQRLGAVEASALLRTVMVEIEVTIFAFDELQTLKLVNRAGEKLLSRPPEQLRGRSAAELGLVELLRGESTQTVPLNLPGSTGRWGIRRSSFRLEGRPHQLLVMTDLSRALRDEERQAWQRIVRVIGHELNNSLAPIKSLAGTMSSSLAKSPRPEDWEDDLQKGLSIIASRADSLGRFMEAYARLARLPAPRLRAVSVQSWIQRVASLETRMRIHVRPSPDLTVQADGDQLEQLLINVVRNAVDASFETQNPPCVTVSWILTQDHLLVQVQDTGPGLSDSANLFVPFFTTKPTGTGLGLVLSRQIAEAHGGTLTLANVTQGHGCIASIRIPCPEVVKESSRG